MDTSTPTLIGLGGLKTSGKDAFADFLVDDHDFVKMGMSDALADALRTLNPYIGNGMRYADFLDDVGYVRAKEHSEVRRLLQVLGTEVGREIIDPEIWTTIMSRRISEHLEAGRPVALTAVRFPNEVQMIKDLGGVLLWVSRPEVTERHKAALASGDDAASHASEVSVDENSFDFVVMNDGPLEKLRDIASTINEAGVVASKLTTMIERES